MYAFEQQIRVRLEFDGMPSPVEISVPWNVLRYLDMHAERTIADDGTVVYHHGCWPLRGASVSRATSSIAA